ncbi:MAG: GAF domain-containing protein [Chloroflexi bacterium]|nr:GAF domain-containing protein [Chloroflexota bacterium]
MDMRSDEARWAATLEALNRLGQISTFPLTQEYLLGQVLKEALGLVSATAGSASVVDPVQHTGQVCAWHGHKIAPTTSWDWGQEYLLGRTARTGEGLLAGPEDLAPSFAPAQARSQLVVPMRDQGAVWGVIHLSSEQPGAFSTLDRHLIQALADRAAQVWYIAQLVENAASKANNLAVLNELSRAFTAELNLDRLLFEIVNASAELVQVPHATLFLSEAVSGELVPRAVYGRSLEQIDAPESGVDVLSWVQEHATAVLLPDVQQPAELAQAAPDYILAQPGSLICVPLLFPGRVMGVLAVDAPAPRVLTLADQILLATLADQAAAAIENVRLHEAEREQTTQMAALYEAAEAITSTLHIQDVFNRILAQLQRVVAYDSAALWLQEGQRLRVAAGHGFPNLDEILQLDVDIDENPLFRVVASSRQPLVIADAESDERFRALGGTTYVRSWMGVPLIIQDRAIGCITIDRREARQFTARDGRLAMAFASQGAVAISTARLFADLEQVQLDLQDAKDLSDNLIENASDMVYALDLEGRFTLLNRAGEEITGYRRQDVIGQPFITILAPEYVSETLKKIKLPKGTIIPTYEVEIVAQDGLRIPLEFSARPLEQKGSVVGVVGVARDIRERKAAEALTQQRTRELAAVNAISTAMSWSLDLNKIAQTIVQEMARVFGVEQCGLVLLQPGRDYGELIAQVRPSGVMDLNLVRIPLTGNQSMEHILQTQQPLYVADVDTDPLIASVRDALRERDIRSLLIVPLISKGQIIGTVGLDSLAESRAFSEDEVRLAQTLANQAAIAIKNAQLYAQTDAALARRVQELDAIEEIDRQLSSTLDYDQVIELVLDSAVTATMAQAGMIALLEPSGYLNILASRGYPAELPPGARWHIDQGVTGRVVRTGQSALIANVDQDPDYAAVIALSRSELAVPILREDKVLGVLNLESPQEGAFQSEHLSFVTHLAEHAGIAIENARLFAETTRRAQEMAGLLQISAIASSTLLLGDMLPQVMQRILDLLDAQTGTTLLFDEARQELVAQYIASVGATPEQIEAFHISVHSPNFAYSIFRAGRSYRTLDAQTDPRILPAYRPFIAEFNVHTLLGVPLRVADRIIGELYVANKRAGAFTQEDENLLSTVATQLAVAIENVRLYQLTEEALAKRVDELEAVRRIGQELNATLDLDQVLSVLIREAVAATSSHHGNIVLQDPATQQFHVAIWHGYTDDEAAILRTLAPDQGTSLTAQVLRSGKPDLVADARQEATPVCIKKETRSALGVPIFYVGDVVGSINLRSLAPNAFHTQDMAFLQALADQASVAIGNARRYQEQLRQADQLRQRADQLSSMLQVGNALRMDLSLEDMLTEVAYAIVEGTPFNMVGLSVAEGNPPILRRVTGAGMPLPMLQEWQAVRQPLSRFQVVMQEEFQISQSYFVPRERLEALQDWHIVIPNLGEQARQEGQWQPGDNLMVPMRGTDGALLGYVTLDDPRDHQRPTRRVVETLEIFANQAAVAIENARLFTSLERQVETQQGLLEMATALQGILDSHRIYEILADYLERMVAFDSLTCYEVDWQLRQIRGGYARGVNADEIMAETFPVEEGITGHVARTGQAEMVNHALDDPRTVQVTGTPLEPESMLAIPFLAHDRVLGVMDVYRKGETIFNDQEFATAQLFANQTAAAVESARLFSESQRRVRELAALNEMALALSATLDLHALVEMVYRQTTRVMDATNLFIALYDSEEKLVSFPLAVEGNERVEQRADFAPRHRGQGLTEHIIDTGLPILIETNLVEWLDEHGIAHIGEVAQSWLGVPLYVGERVSGVIAVQSYARERAYDEEHMSLLMTIAAQAAVAIENARLFEETQRRLGEVAALNRVGQAISSALSLNDLLDVVYQQASTLMDTTNFYIALYDPEHDMVSFPLSIDQFDLDRQQRPSGEGATGYIIRTGQPVLIRENAVESFGRLGIEAVGTLARSWLGVPMMAGEQVLGVMAVQSYEHERLYDSSHLDVLLTIAAQTAVAVENIRLYVEAQARVEEMTNLYGISLATSSTTDVSEALSYIAEGTLALTGAALCIVSVWNPATGQLERQARAAESTRLLDATQDLTPRSDGLSRQVYETRQPLVVPDVTAIPDFNPVAMASGIRSAAAVPMLLRNQAVGVLFVNCTEAHAFSTREMQLLSFLANQAAIAVESSRLFAEIRQFSQELEQRVEERTTELAMEKERIETLHTITSDLVGTLELDPLLERALAKLVHITQADRGAILWLDRRQELLLHRAAYGRQKELPAGGQPTPFRPGVGLAGWVMQHRQPLLVPDVRADDRWLETDSTTTTHSMMLVPVVAGDDVLGVASLSHPQANFFNEDQLRLVATIVGELGIAAHNAELYAYVREQAERMAQMYRQQEEEASKLSAILESIADGVMVSDAQDRIMLANRAAEHVLGTRLDVLTGQAIRRVMGGLLGEDDAAFYDLRQGLVADRQSLARIFEWEGRVISAHIAPMFTGERDLIGAEFMGLVTVFRDITKEYEVDRMKTDFVSTVSHELRTPLTSIKGYVDLILDGDAGEINSDVREFLTTVQRNSDRLTELINDLLDISRIETGRIQLDLEPVRMTTVLEDVLSSQRVQLEEKDLVLHVHAPTDLPLVYADTQRLFRILVNLVSNAYKYTPAGGSVTITVHTTEHMVEVDVQDTGIGISEQDLPRLFSRFFRADDPLVRAISGTGLGLAISRSLVNLHGGEMWVASELGHGSTFSFTIPLVESEERNASSTRPDADPDPIRQIGG